jgi:hypothetical protein
MFDSSELRVDAMQLEARALQSELTGIGHHPLNGVLPLLLAPLITIIVKSLKKPVATPGATTETRAEQKSLRATHRLSDH